ncbi:Phosphoenolpyruvate carboxylase [Gossypium arboreum]|uniref:Phosphoenolpyruvate carboxylase n=1 Tax=Gossypium arboreum TaxID=29729 RepID=A0A0B0MMD8_GOSAR|nr:Phosphoenolpyruvate carboxylase [Gossypium arboreum]
MCIAEKMPRRRLRDLSIVQNTPNLEETNSEQQTVIGSLNAPEATDEPVEIQRYLGIIARNANMLPINYESWHQMPDSNKNQALDDIKERFALEVSDTYNKKALGKKWREHKSTLKKEYFKKDISLEEKLRTVPPRMLRTVSELEQATGKNKNSRTQQGRKVLLELSSGQKVGHLQLFDITHRKKDGSPMTSEAGEIMEKLKDKKAKYEAIASSDSFVNIEEIDNRIIIKVLVPQRYGQSLRDQMAKMQVSTVEQITQLKVEVASREAEVQRKYEGLQLQLKDEAAVREAEQNRKYNKLQLQLQNMIKMFQQPHNPPS